MDSNKTVLYVPVLNIDISCTPGCVVYETPEKGYLSKDVCQKEVDRLNEELDKELSSGEEPPPFEEWVKTHITDFRTDEPEECKGLTDEQLIEKYDLRDEYETDVEEFEDEDFDGDYMGFNLSGRPFWSVDEIPIVG